MVPRATEPGDGVDGTDTARTGPSV